MKAIKIFLVCFLTSLNGIGQDTTFHVSIGTPGAEDAVDLFETENGFLLFGSTGHTGSGQSDIYIVDLSEDLVVSDFRTIGTAGIERLTSVCQGDNGSFLLASHSYNGYAVSDYDVRLDVLDSAGISLLTTIIEEPGIQIPIDICSKDDKIFVLVKRSVISSIDAFFIYVFDFQLNELQSFNVSIEDSFALNSMEILNNSIWLTGEITPEDSLNSNLLTLKLSFSGNILIQKSFGGAGRDLGSALYFDTDSTLIVTGSTNSFDSIDYDSYILRIDTMMNLVWSETFGFNPFVQNNDDFGVKTIKAFDGKLYNGVSTRTYGEGGEDFHLYQMTSAGVFEEGNSFGLSKTESLASIIQSSDSNFYLFGTTNSDGFGQTDLFLVKTPTASVGPIKVFSVVHDTLTEVTYVVSITELDKSPDIGYLIYSESRPIFMLNTFQSEVIARIYNMQGQLVLEDRNVKGNVSFQGLKTGIYTLKIGNNKIGFQDIKVITPTQ